MTTEINHSARAHALLSASIAHRWLACPPSAVAAAAYPDPDTEFTREGTTAHEVAEIVARQRFLGGSDVSAPEGATDEMLDHANAYADYIAEQITTDNPIILLEERVDFSEWVPDGFGTADCIIIQGDTMDVIDYKYGQGVPVSAEDNPQLKLYGLGAVYDYGFLHDVKTVRLHIFQPRLDNVSTYETTTDRLLLWAGTIVRPTAEQAAKGDGEYHAGTHCKFCPHAGQCRELTAQCTIFVEEHDLRVTVPKLAPHEIAEVLAMEPLLALWLKRVKAQAMSILMDGGEVPGYKVVEGRQGNREWADDLRVAEILRDNGYTSEDFTETRLYSPAGMDQALGKKRVAELLGGMIIRKPGAPTIVPDTDKRPAYDRLAEAQRDFE